MSEVHFATLVACGALNARRAFQTPPFGKRNFVAGWGRPLALSMS